MLLLCPITTAIDQTPANRNPVAGTNVVTSVFLIHLASETPDAPSPRTSCWIALIPDGLTDELWLHDVVPALDISVLEGTMTVSVTPAYDCYNLSGAHVRNSSDSIGLPDLYTIFSDTQNLYTAIGCDTTAFLSNLIWANRYGATCITLCNGTVLSLAADNSTCTGAGGCWTKVRPWLKSLFVLSLSINNNTNVSAFNPCGYAFLADKRSFKASDWQLSDLPGGKASNVAIEWVVETKTCEEAQDNTGSYACGNYTDWIYSNNSQAYGCLCKDGFTGILIFHLDDEVIKYHMH